MSTLSRLRKQARRWMDELGRIPEAHEGYDPVDGHLLTRQHWQYPAVVDGMVLTVLYIQKRHKTTDKLRARLHNIYSKAYWKYRGKKPSSCSECDDRHNAYLKF